MSLEKMSLDNIKYKICYGYLTKERLSKINSEVGIILPNYLVHLLEKCDGGVPVKSSFEYFDFFKNKKMISTVGGYLNFSESDWSDFLQTYKSPHEFFPEGLIAFAGTGGGDYICFDYRQGKDNPNPPIIYWDHGADIGRDVSFIADNFAEFIGMLKEPDDY